MTLRPLRLLALACIAAVVFPVMAYAATAAPNTAVHLSSVIGYAFEMLTAAIGVLALWAVHRYAKKLGLEINDQQRAFLDQAIHNGIAWTMKTAESAVDARLGSVSVKDPKIAQVANYVVEHAPDAITHFGVTAEQLERKILAKLPA